MIQTMYYETYVSYQERSNTFATNSSLLIIFIDTFIISGIQIELVITYCLIIKFLIIYLIIF